jgi:hypothetical protein
MQGIRLYLVISCLFALVCAQRCVGPDSTRQWYCSRCSPAVVWANISACPVPTVGLPNSTFVHLFSVAVTDPTPPAAPLMKDRIFFALASPLDAVVRNGSLASVSVNASGYDAFVGQGCVPSNGFWNNYADAGAHVLKSVVVNASAAATYFIALESRRLSGADPNASCTLRMSGGYLVTGVVSRSCAETTQSPPPRAARPSPSSQMRPPFSRRRSPAVSRGGVVFVLMLTLKDPPPPGSCLESTPAPGGAGCRRGSRRRLPCRFRSLAQGASPCGGGGGGRGC